MPEGLPVLGEDVTIRPASLADLPAVSALLTAARLTLNAVDAQFGPQFAVAVETSTGDIVGAAGVEVYGDGESAVGLFRSAVVAAPLRGRGLGVALADNRVTWAEGEALAALYLLTETAADYWPRFGFERIARDAAPAALMASHEWRQGCPGSAVAMRLALPRSTPS